MELQTAISPTWGDLNNVSGRELALMLQITGLLQSSLCTTIGLTRNESDRGAVLFEQHRRRS